MDSTARIASLLKRISQLVGRRAKEEREQLDTALEDLAGLAKKHGLDPKSLDKGYALALGGRMVTADALALLPCLIPRGPLPLRAVLLTVSSLREATHSLPTGAGHVDYKVQRRALEQLGVLLELGAVGKEGSETLDRLYGVVERGLDYKTLRDPSAAVLSQIVRRHHAQEHRIKALQELIRRLESPSSSILRLLEHYRSFQPEQVYEQRGKGRKDRGTVLEGWKDVVQAVREGGNEGEHSQGRESKRRRTSAQSYIPLPTTYSLDATSTAAVPLSDVTSLATLAKHVDTLHLPSQAASALLAVPGATASTPACCEEERTKAWALLLRSGFEGNHDHVHRLSTWLISQLQHELYDLDPSPEGTARIEDLLTRAKELSEMGGELIESLEPFLAEWLLKWDGKAHKKVLFELVALLKPLEFDALCAHFLRPLEACTGEASAEWIADFVVCLTSLVSNLVVRDDWGDVGLGTTAFGRLDDAGLYVPSVQSLLDLADRVITSATRRFPSSLILRSAALSFYEAAVAVPLEHGLAAAVLPSSLFVFTCLLSGEVMSLSRICGLITRLREALTSSDSAMSTEQPENADLVDALNSLLIDLVNTLWQKKFLVPLAGSDEAMGLTSDDLEALRAYGERRQQPASASQGLTVHAALAPLAKECLVALAAEQNKSGSTSTGVVTASSLKALGQDPSAIHISFNDFRPAFLEELHEKGAEGIHDILFSSLQSLINRVAAAEGTARGA
ncbi:hypothetical protein JCM10213_003381 [Rhodosporidiobolus nylandii]